MISDEHFEVDLVVEIDLKGAEVDKETIDVEKEVKRIKERFEVIQRPNFRER